MVFREKKDCIPGSYVIISNASNFTNFFTYVNALWRFTQNKLHHLMAQMVTKDELPK